MPIMIDPAGSILANPVLKATNAVLNTAHEAMIWPSLKPSAAGSSDENGVAQELRERSTLVAGIAGLLMGLAVAAVVWRK